MLPSCERFSQLGWFPSDAPGYKYKTSLIGNRGMTRHGLLERVSNLWLVYTLCNSAPIAISTTSAKEVRFGTLHTSRFAAPLCVTMSMPFKCSLAIY